MPLWLTILNTVLGILIIGARITAFFYYKCKNGLTCSKILSMLWHKENIKETKAMLSDSPQESIDYSKIKVTSEMVKEMLEMLEIDFSYLNKCTNCINCKDGSKITTTFV